MVGGSFYYDDFFPYSVKELNKIDDDTHDEIHFWCYNVYSKPCLLRIVNFDHRFIVEVPHGQNHNLFALAVKSWLSDIMGDRGPTSVVKYDKYKAQPFMQRKFSFIELRFKSLQSAKWASSLLTKSVSIPYINHEYNVRININTKNLLIHENNFNDCDNIKKMIYFVSCANKQSTGEYFDIRYSGWQKFMVRNVTKKKKISKLQDEYIIDFMKTKKSEIEIIPTPVVCSFDIESYTPNDKMKPKSGIISCPSYLISMAYGRMCGERKMKKVLIILGEGTINKYLHDVEVHNVNNEIDYLDKMCDIIIESGTTIILGWNNIGYDIPYLNDRCMLYDNKWKNISFLKNYNAGVIDGDVTGIMDGFMYFDAPGLITLDSYLFIKMFNYIYKFKFLSLKYVSANMLKNENKVDLSYLEQFFAYRMFLESNDEFLDYKRRDKSEQIIETCYDKLYELANDGNDTKFHLINDYNEMLEITEKIFNEQVELSNTKRISSRHVGIITRRVVALYMMHCVCHYSVKDAELPWLITDTCSMIISLCMMALCDFSNIETELTRGKQYKCYSIIYINLKKYGYVVNNALPNMFRFEGGYVAEPVIGIHENVCTFDANSLYPNMLITINADYSTIIRDAIPPNLTKDDYITIEVDAGEGNEPYICNWVKPHIREGVLSIIEKELMATRKLVKKQMNNYDKTSDEYKTNDALQNGLKNTCNSIYGFLGIGCNTESKKKKSNSDEYGGKQYYGKYPLPEGAICITHLGRQTIKKARTILEDLGAIIYYGDTDSVMFTIPTYTTDMKRRYDELCSWLSSQFGEYVNFESENICVILLLGKKNYVKWLIGPDDKPLINKFGIVDKIEKGVPGARNDRAPILVNIHRTIGDMLYKKKSSIEIYDYVISECAKIYSGEIDDAVFSKLTTYNSRASDTYYIKKFVNKANAKGKAIKSGEKIQLLVIKTDESKSSVSDRLVLYEDFNNAKGTKYEMQLDYNYYIEKLEKQIDAICSVAQPLPKKFSKYRLNYGRDSITTLDKTPIKFMVVALSYGITPVDILRKYRRTVKYYNRRNNK